jgi:hypothetical protein
MSAERRRNVCIAYSSFLGNSDMGIDSMAENIDEMRSVETVATHQQREGLLQNGNLHLPVPSNSTVQLAVFRSSKHVLVEKC